MRVLTSALGQPANEFKVGDRVQITGSPKHDPTHFAGTVSIVHAGPAYGILMDGMESMGTHKWYTGDELGQGPTARTIGPIVLVPDLIMSGLGIAGIVGSAYIRHKTVSMIALMVGSMALAVGMHTVLMRLTSGALSAELVCPPR